MNAVEVECKNCRKSIYILEEYIRSDTFCTLGCMDEYEKLNGHII